jgi:RNA polymerase sigma-70 factor, ECF subfamily
MISQSNNMGTPRSIVVNEFESEWLKDAKRGDQAAFGRLIEVYQTPVYNLCYRMLSSANDAEDAAQETFIRAYHGLSRYDIQRSFSTWLLSIAAHYCIDQIRRRRFTVMSFEELPAFDPPDLEPGPERTLVAKEKQQQVQALLESLNPQDRAAVVMRYWYDFSYEEIGESLSLTVSAVKSRLHRARRELAALWAEQAPIPQSIERTRHESPAF